MKCGWLQKEGESDEDCADGEFFRSECGREELAVFGTGFCARYYLATILVVLWLALFSSRYATVWGLFQRDVLNEVR